MKVRVGLLWMKMVVIKVSKSQKEKDEFSPQTNTLNNKARINFFKNKLININTHDTTVIFSQTKQFSFTKKISLESEQYIIPSFKIRPPLVIGGRGHGFLPSRHRRRYPPHRLGAFHHRVGRHSGYAPTA